MFVGMELIQNKISFGFIIIKVLKVLFTRLESINQEKIQRHWIQNYFMVVFFLFVFFYFFVFLFVIFLLVYIEIYTINKIKCNNNHQQQLQPSFMRKLEFTRK